MKVSIVGVGKVGVTLGYSIVLKGLATELVLVSRSAERIRGEALDLQHAAALGPSRVRVQAGDIEATRGSQVVVLALAQSAEQGGSAIDRIATARPNAQLFQQVVPKIAELSPDAILLVVTNPVDVLTYATLKLSGFDRHRVLGTGTLIDSARFRSLLSAHYEIHSDDIRAYVLGEHGESQFPVLSAVYAGGWYMGKDPEVKRAFEKTLSVAPEVFLAKGYTNFAVASAAAMILQAIKDNSHHTMPVSTLVDGYYGIEDVCLSLPAVIGQEGIAQVLSIALSEEEQAQLRYSAQRLSTVNESLAPFFQPAAS
ncbi:lactate dehydrogenase [Blastopirellula marina]|uniref:Lactate dehydrogenase n=1 Tax=Blastopirellula marina TaxID=124 RepID=A0A2S8FN31_9BACT|nr:MULTISPECIES: lactate dehydrogenase [Pirellulaceae]PQO33264.1 lactate dehydrogenase [Blastopirellula marina]RCS52353.1 lactate dehydrogenase [Bremerella cremea]